VQFYCQAGAAAHLAQSLDLPLAASLAARWGAWGYSQIFSRMVVAKLIEKL